MFDPAKDAVLDARDKPVAGVGLSGSATATEMVSDPKTHKAKSRQRKGHTGMPNGRLFALLTDVECVQIIRVDVRSSTLFSAMPGYAK